METTTAPIESEMTKAAAMVFLSSVRRAISGFERFEQLRVGKNFMQEPTIFAVIDKNMSDQIWKIRSIARKVETITLDRMGLLISVWTVVGGNLDQTAIDIDFPWICREEVGKSKFGSLSSDLMAPAESRLALGCLQIWIDPLTSAPARV